jgi:hypothetical protein
MSNIEGVKDPRLRSVATPPTTRPCATARGVMSVGGSVYTLTLAVASVEVARQNVGAGAELPIWAGLTILGVATVILLFAAMRRPGGLPT